MKGWQNLFSKSEQTGKKPFPKDRFFSPEELEFLDTTQSELSLLEKWALQLAKWARDKSETSNFPQVKWQAGRFSTWVDNIEEIDSKNKQIERFRQLKADGYVLPSAYESMIEDKLGKDLVGMFSSRDMVTRNESVQWMPILAVILQENHILHIPLSFLLQHNQSFMKFLLRGFSNSFNPRNWFD